MRTTVSRSESARLASIYACRAESGGGEALIVGERGSKRGFASPTYRASLSCRDWDGGLWTRDESSCSDDLGMCYSASAALGCSRTGLSRLARRSASFGSSSPPRAARSRDLGWGCQGGCRASGVAVSFALLQRPAPCL